MNTLLTFICVFIFIGMVVFVLYLVYDEFIIDRVKDEQITGEITKNATRKNSNTKKMAR